MICHAIEFRSNLGLGVSNTKQELAEKYDFDAPAGAIDVLGGWGPLRFGAIYAKAGYAPEAGTSHNIDGLGLVLGFGIGRWVEAIAGYGLGNSSRKEETFTSKTKDNFSGPAVFAGVRLHLFEIKKITIGLSATYVGMSDKEYINVVDNTSTSATTTITKDVDSSMIIYGLNFNFATKSGK